MPLQLTILQGNLAERKVGIDEEIVQMTAEEARAGIAIHAGNAEGFTDGYVYALRYGFRNNLEDVQQKFDDIFKCLKVLKKSSCFLYLDKELIRDLSQILWQSILYMRKQLSYYRVIGVFAEVLSETLVDFFGDTEEPFAAFDNYKGNYDDIFCQAIENGS